MITRRPYPLNSLAGLIILVLLCGCDLQTQQAAAPSGQLRVITYPEGAAVECDGIPHDISPANIESLEAGPHLVVARKEGYRDARQTVTLVDGQTGKVAELTLEPLQGLVLIHAEPEVVDVKIEGAFSGKTPLLITNLPLGQHRLVFKADGYFEKEMNLVVEDRIPQKVKVELVSDSADIIFTSTPSGAFVDVGGIRRGRTPMTVGKIPSGMAQVEISLEGYEAYQETVKLNPGDHYEVKATLKPIPGSLSVESMPPKARVYVENQFKGNTPFTLKDLAPGSYRVRVELRGYETDARNVNVLNDQKKVEEFRLVKNSGMLQVSTQPAGVEVFVDGEKVGITRSADSDAVSEPLLVELLPQGPHKLQLTKKGYANTVKTFRVTTDQVTSLQEKLTRKFIPNYEVRTGKSADHILRGNLVRKHPSGDITLELSPGIFRTILAEDIISSGPLKTQDVE